MTNPHLDRMRTRARDNRSLADSLLTPMIPEQLGWRPAPRSWSAIEVLEHLNRAAEGYLERIQRALDTSRRRRLVDDGRFRAGWVQSWFIRQVEPRADMRRLPAPGAFRPVERASVDESIRERYFECNDLLLQLMLEADGVHLYRVRFASPITPLLRFNLGEAFWMLVAHEARHLQQIQRIAASPGYPAR
jgi:hypothetical protein